MGSPFMGQLMLFPYSFIPKGWAVCDGKLLQISGNQALFSLLGTSFGGDGRTNFGLPDLRGRTPIGSSPTYNLGNVGGEEGHKLTSNEIPQHNHLIQGINAAGNQPKPNGALLATTDSTLPIYQAAPGGGAMDGNTIALAGAGQAHENRSPYLVLTWCIALTGLFPSRN